MRRRNCCAGAGGRATRPALDVPRRAARRGRRAVRRHDIADLQLAPPHDAGPRQRPIAGAALEAQSCRRDRLLRRPPQPVRVQPCRRPRRRRQRHLARDVRGRRRRPHPVDHRCRRRAHRGDGLRRRRTSRRADVGDGLHHPLRLRPRASHDVVRSGLQPVVGLHPRRARACRDVRHGGRVPLLPAVRRARPRRQPARPRRPQLHTRRQRTDGLRSEEVRWSSGDVERYDYDWLGRLVRQESNTATTRFAYDGESLLPSRIDACRRSGPRRRTGVALRHTFTHRRLRRCRRRDRRQARRDDRRGDRTASVRPPDTTSARPGRRRRPPSRRPRRPLRA